MRVNRRIILSGIAFACFLVIATLVAGQFVTSNPIPIWHHDDVHHATCYTLNGRAIDCWPDPAP